MGALTYFLSAECDFRTQNAIFLFFFLENRLKLKKITKGYQKVENRTQSAECDEILRFECGVRRDATRSECELRPPMIIDYNKYNKFYNL